MKTSQANANWVAVRIAVTFLVVAVGLLLAGALAKPAYALQAGKLQTESSLTTQATIIDNETNKDFNSAQQFSVGDTVYGEQGQDEEWDYFKVNVGVSGYVKIALTNDAYYDSYGETCMWLYNQYYESEGNRLEAEYRTTRPTEMTMYLTKGVHYLEVGPYNDYYRHVAQPYRFKLTYVIEGTDITKVTPAKKAGTVQWTKRINADKYQLRYSTKKNMSNAKTVNVAKKYTSKKITKLKKNTKYYVQARVVKTIDGKDWYSSWSTKKVLKTKK